MWKSKKTHPIPPCASFNKSFARQNGEEGLENRKQGRKGLKM